MRQYKHVRTTIRIDEHDDHNEQWTLRNEKQRAFGKHLSNDRSITFWNSLQFEEHDLDRIKIGIIGVSAEEYRFKAKIIFDRSTSRSIISDCLT